MPAPAHRPIPRALPPSARPRWRRRLRVIRARARRLRARVARRLTLFSGWVWVAAISFVGIEAFEVVFGAFLLAPELLPVALVGLAAAWYFRQSLRRAWRVARLRLRRARPRRQRAE